MTFFYDLNKKLKQIAEQSAAPTTQQLNEGKAAKKDRVEEKWDKETKVAPSEKGKYKGVGLEQLRSRLAKLKKSGPHKKGSKEYGTMKELQFAIRAKTGWGKVEEAAKPDYIDLDRDGNKKETMKKAAKDAKKTKKLDEVSPELAARVLQKRADQIFQGRDPDMSKFDRTLQFKKIQQLGPRASANVDSDEQVTAETMSPAMKDKFAALAPPRNKITYADKIAGARKHSKNRSVADESSDDPAELQKDAPGRARMMGGVPPAQAATTKPQPADTAKPYQPGLISRVTDPFAKLGPMGGKTQAGSMGSGTYEGVEDRLEKARAAHKERTGREVVGRKLEKDEKPKWLTTHKGKYGTEYQGDDEEGAKKPAAGEKRGRGRPKGTGRRIGAKGPTGRSKLLRNEEAGGMDREQLHTIARGARQLKRKLGKSESVPRDVQSKLAKIQSMISDIIGAGGEPVTEKAVSRKQQRFMGMVHAAQKGEKPASAAVAKVAKEMPKKSAKDFAKTKHKGLPEKVKSQKDESIEETTTSGSVATAPAAAPKGKKGMQFGKGIYDSLNRDLEKMISEGMNVSVNMGTNPDGENTKSISINADGEDAEKLAQLLNLAGIHKSEETCSACGQSPCGCDQIEEQVSENQPDWPTDTETQDTKFMTKTIAGGLNKPKQTGQTTVPVLNKDPARQGANGVREAVDLGMKLYKEYQGYKKAK